MPACTLVHSPAASAQLCDTCLPLTLACCCPLPPQLEADALLGSAQVQVAAKEWSAAEETLGAALKAAEGVSTEQHPRLAAALMLLGQVYSRSARVTFAEGMLREAAKMVRYDPVKAVGLGAAGAQTHVVHSSLLAALAWRHAQLLAALPPSRASEAQLWRGCAEQLWEQAGGPYSSCEGGAAAVLGSLDTLKGQGSGGSGALLSLAARRLLLVPEH